MPDFFERLDFQSLWHLKRIVLPRRSVHGRWVWGLVWRRHDGSGWTYKHWKSLAVLGVLNIMVVAE